MFCKKGVLKNVVKLTGKQLCQSLFFNEVAALRLATLSKKRLWHRYFPVSFAKFLRTSFLTEHLRWLPNQLCNTSHDLRPMLHSYRNYCTANQLTGFYISERVFFSPLPPTHEYCVKYMRMRNPA